MIDWLKEKDNQKVIKTDKKNKIIILFRIVQNEGACEFNKLNYIC